jgi:hypothetical protein
MIRTIILDYFTPFVFLAIPIVQKIKGRSKDILSLLPPIWITFFIE